MTTLYNICTSIDRTDGLSYRITKFVDGEVESSYLTSREACECPAGHRSTCRHRQMLPDLLNHAILNTHYFWDFDHKVVTLFDGSYPVVDAHGYELPEGDETEEDTSQDTRPAAITNELIDEAIEYIDRNPSLSPTTPPTPASAWRRF